MQSSAILAIFALALAAAPAHAAFSNRCRLLDVEGEYFCEGVGRSSENPGEVEEVEEIVIIKDQIGVIFELEVEGDVFEPPSESQCSLSPRKGRKTEHEFECVGTAKFENDIGEEIEEEILEEGLFEFDKKTCEIERLEFIARIVFLNSVTFQESDSIIRQDCKPIDRK